MNVQLNGLTPKEQLMCAYTVKLLNRFNIKLEASFSLSKLKPPYKDWSLSSFTIEKEAIGGSFF